MPSAQRLILFTRYPAPGTAKTRLIPLLGEEGAALFQRRMTELVARLALQLAERIDLTPFIYYCDGSEEEMRGWLGKGFTYRPQAEGDLGQRMYQAFADGFADGARRIVLAGCDIPGLTGPILESAFDNLTQYPAVLGPAMDGGYYLLGLGSEIPAEQRAALFSGIPWSTAGVFTQTANILVTAGLPYALLPVLQDIDTPDDYSAAGHLGPP